METITYRLFGIPIWSVTRTVKDDDTLYERITRRLAEDLRRQQGR